MGNLYSMYLLGAVLLIFLNVELRDLQECYVWKEQILVEWLSPKDKGKRNRVNVKHIVEGKEVCVISVNNNKVRELPMLTGVPALLNEVCRESMRQTCLVHKRQMFFLSNN